MAVEGVSPTLIPSKVVEMAEAKRAPKKAKKEPVAISTESAAPTDSTAPKGKKRAASKGPEDPTTSATPTTEEGAEGEKVVGETSGALIVAKAVRTLLKNHTTPIHLGSDALPALNAKVTEMIYEAIGRSLANGRKTLKNSDF